jgi:hypothetical protein
MSLVTATVAGVTLVVVSGLGHVRQTLLGTGDLFTELVNNGVATKMNIRVVEHHVIERVVE